MKKLLSLAAALLCTSFMLAQTMKKTNIERRFHAMSENGKYMLTVDQGYIGIYNTETDEYKEWQNVAIGYDLGLGNMVTNDGFLVGCIEGAPSILDIEKGEWTSLPMQEGDKMYSCANAITNSRKYITGYVTKGSVPRTVEIVPVLWSQKEDGTYGTYEILPYPEKDFTGVAPKYLLPNCISEDGTVIAAQLLRCDNECLPLVYRKAQDGTWTYEVYDKDLCEPGLEFPEMPVGEGPAAPNQKDYMTPESYEKYHNDSLKYEEDSWKYQIGEITEMPTWPDPKSYMTDEARAQYDKDWETYAAETEKFMSKLREFRNFFYANVKSNFYAQNGVWLSPNGKYYATTCNKNYTLGDAALFDVNETLTLHDYKDGLMGYCCTDDGDFFVSDGGTAYVYPAGSTERVTLQDWLRLKGETGAADWLDKNVTTGTAICSGDGRVISGFSGAPGAYTSWIIKLDGNTTGITDAVADGDSRVKVYDLQGRFVKEGAANEVKTGLRRGIYIINNKKVVIK